MGYTGDIKDTRISHGICPSCHQQQMREINALQEERRKTEAERFRANTITALRREE
jgi:hypothetical protein